MFGRIVDPMVKLISFNCSQKTETSKKVSFEEPAQWNRVRLEKPIGTDFQLSFDNINVFRR